MDGGEHDCMNPKNLLEMNFVPKSDCKILFYKINDLGTRYSSRKVSWLVKF